MVIFLILIIPMTGFIVISGFMSTIEIPEFIMETIYKTPVFLGAFILLILSLAFLAVKWIFSIHCFVLEKKTFRESRKMSSSMVNGRFWEIAGSVVLWNLILAAAFAAVYLSLIHIFYRLRVDKARCTECGACKASCRLKIDPCKTPNSMECIRCGRCVKACGAGALRRGIK